MIASRAQTPATTRYSVDDLDQFPNDGKLRELVDGQIVEWGVTTAYHGWLLVALSHALRAYVLERQLGLVVGGDPMVMIQGSRYDARGPDVAFFRRGNIPPDLGAAASSTVPDFVIEVLSPSDRAGMVQEKVLDWLRSGVRLLWYVDPETRHTIVYDDNRISGVGPDETLDGGPVVPGFTVRLADFYRELEALQVPIE